MKQFIFTRDVVDGMFKCHCGHYEHVSKKNFTKHTSRCKSHYVDVDEEDVINEEDEDVEMSRDDDNVESPRQSVLVPDTRLRLRDGDEIGGLAYVSSPTTESSLIVCYVCKSLITVRESLIILFLNVSALIHLSVLSSYIEHLVD
jgi:hypothetical protein